MAYFDKVLVANRSEIAVRVMRTLREMGIRSVAIYSDVDRDSPHVWESDEAYCVGRPPSQESYLNMENILTIAAKADVRAIHPGYGFLAENATFARICEQSGFVFIGPSSKSISLLGDKAEARRRVAACGVPVIPGSEGGVKSAGEAISWARKLGYPVLLKPVGGGGGKGMRTVRGPAEMESALRASQSEAQKAFADDRVYVEKLLPAPRHIEFQVMADTHGNVIHLCERECSIQRRHQKLIEEAPSPVLTPDLRDRMGNAAREATRAAQYTNAGTVEFLLDEKLNFYFMEMNTRLQVEHPVTEFVTGTDLVFWQIAIAGGEEIPERFKSMKPRGWAIECRISSEDPFNDFLPSAGKITAYEVPGGPWVRVDSGVTVGSEVTLFYDPLMAKLIVWAQTRPEAIRRMKRALSEFRIAGVKTTVPFHLLVLSDRDFQKGVYDTSFLSKKGDLSHLPGDCTKELAAMLGALVTKVMEPEAVPGAARREAASTAQLSPWKSASFSHGVSREESWRTLQRGARRSRT
jgi:acetyl-CoA carboxylase biotin carboxylase subunit